MTRHERIAVDAPERAPAGSDDGKREVGFGPLSELAGFMLRLAQLRLFESFFRDLSEEQTSPGQIGILVALDGNPGVRQGVLAEALHIKRSNMAKIIRLLERAGLIRREVPDDDRRAIELYLTDKGSAFVVDATPKVIASDHAATTALSARERATLLRLLAKLANPARPS